MDAIKVEKISFTYPDGTHALRDVDFHARRGSRVAVLGPNGSGKTTLFYHFNGLHMPSKGRVIVGGDEVTSRNLRDVRRRVGLVFQNPDDQLIATTVWDDVAFGPLNLGWSDVVVEDAVSASLDVLGISHLAGRSPDRLSGGEKKRVAIAGVLAMGPEVIVLDEPTAGLDPRGAADIISVMDELHADSKTLIISTHDVDLAASWADEAYLLNDGRVAAHGQPYDIFTDLSLIHDTGLRVPTILRTHRELRARGFTRGEPPLSVLDLVDGVELGVRCAISHRDIHGGERLALVMRDGSLYTAEDGDAWGRAAYDSPRGEDILLTHIEGTVSQPIGSIHIIPVPRIAEGGSRASNPKNAERIVNALGAERVGAMGTSAKVLVRKAGLRLDYDVDVVQSSIMAALRGLCVVVFASGGMAQHISEKIKENNRLRGRTIPYHVENILC